MLLILVRLQANSGETYGACAVRFCNCKDLSEIYEILYFDLLKVLLVRNGLVTFTNFFALSGSLIGILKRRSYELSEYEYSAPTWIRYDKGDEVNSP